jgi:hypothetical protein
MSEPAALTSPRILAANISDVSTIYAIFTDWLAWERRGPANRVLFVLSLSLAAFVTLTFAAASLDPDPGNFARYFAFYWVWGLCAIGVLLGMAEYKTSPLRKGRERGHLFILLYIGALLIVTRALNMVLYAG